MLPVFHERRDQIHRRTRMILRNGNAFRKFIWDAIKKRHHVFSSKNI